jgi:nucleotide-binding universal stress UspA family protein
VHKEGSDPMTTPPDEAPAILVVGHSRDPASDHGLTVAIDLAGRLRARLHVVHVVDIGDYPIDCDAADWEEQGQHALAEQRNRVEQKLAGTALVWTYETRRGDPTAELARAAEDHDALLIVVGTRGEGLRATLSRLIEPSVSHGVIQREHWPVLVVPAPDIETGPHERIESGPTIPRPADGSPEN